MKKSDKTMRCYKITAFGDKKSLYVNEQELGSALTGWLEGMSVGYGLKVEVVEINTKKFNILPDFEV